MLEDRKRINFTNYDLLARGSKPISQTANRSKDAAPVLKDCKYANFTDYDLLARGGKPGGELLQCHGVANQAVNCFNVVLRTPGWSQAGNCSKDAAPMLEGRKLIKFADSDLLARGGKPISQAVNRCVDDAGVESGGESLKGRLTHARPGIFTDYDLLVWGGNQPTSQLLQQAAV